MNTDEMLTNITRETAGRVSRAQAKAGLTNSDLSKEMDTPRTTLVRKLKGDKRFTFEELYWLSKRFDITIGELLPTPEEVTR